VVTVILGVVAGLSLGILLEILRDQGMPRSCAWLPADCWRCPALGACSAGLVEECPEADSASPGVKAESARLAKNQREVLMRNLFISVLATLVVISFTIGHFVTRGQAAAPVVVSEIQGTDAECEAMDRLVRGFWERVLPRGWLLLGHQEGAKSVPHKVYHVKVKRSFLWPERGRRPYLFGSRFEDQVKDGRVVRPFFAGITQNGSFLYGRSLRRARPKDLAVVVRSNKVANTVTIFEIID